MAVLAPLPLAAPAADAAWPVVRRPHRIGSWKPMHSSRQYRSLSDLLRNQQLHRSDQDILRLPPKYLYFLRAAQCQQTLVLQVRLAGCCTFNCLKGTLNEEPVQISRRTLFQSLLATCSLARNARSARRRDVWSVRVSLRVGCANHGLAGPVSRQSARPSSASASEGCDHPQL